VFGAEVLIWRNYNNLKKPLSVIEIGGKSSKVSCAQVSVSMLLKGFLLCFCNDRRALLLSSSAARLEHFDVKLGQ